ncbi:MAG: HU family DNA-binding protein [Oscillospiraceae bacterium]|jgi:DNA-binding protein HU-beta|nr:HU family DNA-binding protein [Oscillospiraceae bacterium]
MNKQEFIGKLAEQQGIAKKDAAANLDAVLKAIADALAAGEKIQFVGFGNFEVRDRAERVVRNPQKPDETVVSPATRVPAFKPGKALKDAVAK